MKNKSQLAVASTPVSVDYVIEEIRKRTSLESVLEAGPVQDLAKGGEFSTSQRALIATVVSVMQDDLIGLAEDQVAVLREELREQRHFVKEIVGRTAAGLIIGLRNGWTMPLITEDAAPAGESIPPTIAGRIKAFLNWGNFATAAGVLVLCVALYYTKAYSSLKDRVDNQGKYVQELEGQNKKDEEALKTAQDTITSVTTQLTDAKSNAAIAQAKYDTAQSQLNNQNGSASDLQSQLTSAQAKTADLSARAAAAEAKLSVDQNDAKTFQKLFQDEQRNRTKAEEAAATLNKENQKLALDLQACKSKHP